MFAVFNLRNVGNWLYILACMQSHMFHPHVTPSVQQYVMALMYLPIYMFPLKEKTMSLYKLLF